MLAILAFIGNIIVHIFGNILGGYFKGVAGVLVLWLRGVLHDQSVDSWAGITCALSWALQCSCWEEVDGG